MFRFVDRISGVFGALAAFLFLLIGLMLSYEVIARYLFNAPTSWAEEGSRMLQLWATFLGAAFILRDQGLIRVSAIVLLLPERLQRVAEAITLLFIIWFSWIACSYGLDIAMESQRIGRTTDTMNQVPRVLTEAAVPIGFALLALQAAVDLIRVLRGEKPRAHAETEQV
ncbi:MAG: C4-dicarboxylate ABC transporter substrate-binding protein [Rhodospirillaceae bacterium]|nr:C4-dicarboxylate ABC transporter substrate-binding protein [Rhodospirillaceae bacterium]|tara:strand:+ start:1007 stop:1513 length:507 start_codon:yes stop_codon:yes gene_type:complete